MEHLNEKKPQRIVLIGASIGDKSLNDTDDASMNELEELVKTASGEVIGSIVQNIKTVDPRYFLGAGKVKEIKEFIDKNDITMAVFDSELSGSMTRNLEEELGVTVIDRSRLILDIFAMRAKSKEGKLQVELAQLNYILPRLSGIGESLSRLGGGIGTRGPGETKLESDRRHIRKRIEHLTLELNEVEKHRANIRRRRLSDSVPVIALAGYTNAGKSSLLNLLTKDNHAYVEDKLFATLDPLTKKIKLNEKTDVCITDTVGFIRKLPHHLIKAFKSTLEELKYADIILNIIDSSDNEAENALSVVNQILKEIGVDDTPVINVFNKCDLKMPPLYLTDTDSVVISVKEESNIDKLIDKITNVLFSDMRKATLLIPFNQGKVMGFLYKNTTVLKEESKENGFLVSVIANGEAYCKIKDYEV